MRLPCGTMHIPSTMQWFHWICISDSCSAVGICVCAHIWAFSGYRKCLSWWSMSHAGATWGLPVIARDNNASTPCSYEVNALIVCVSHIECHKCPRTFVHTLLRLSLSLSLSLSLPPSLPPSLSPPSLQWNTSAWTVYKRSLTSPASKRWSTRPRSLPPSCVRSSWSSTRPSEPSNPSWARASWSWLKSCASIGCRWSTSVRRAGPSTAAPWNWSCACSWEESQLTSQDVRWLLLSLCFSIPLLSP